MLLMRAYLFVISVPVLLFGAEIVAKYNGFVAACTSKAEIEDVSDERIPNLYAAAKVTESVRGTAYISGTLFKLFLKGTGN